MVKLRNTVLAVATLTMLLTATALADPDVGGNGGLSVGWGYTPFPSTKVAGINLVDLVCNQGYTCGQVKIVIDWDDGTVDTTYWNLNACPGWFYHEYASNGLAHASVWIEDEDQYGNWLSIDDLDIYINS
jgi:hypothetical protein